MTAMPSIFYKHPVIRRVLFAMQKHWNVLRLLLVQTFGKPTVPTANLILLQNCKSH